MTTGRINQVCARAGHRGPAFHRAPCDLSAAAGAARSRQLRKPGHISPRRGASCGLRARQARRGDPAGARLTTSIQRRLRRPSRVPASFAFQIRAPAPPLSSGGSPLGTVRLRTATLTKACDPSATASLLPLGRLPPRKKTPGYAVATVRLRPRARLDTTALPRQDTDALPAGRQAGRRLRLRAEPPPVVPAAVRLASRPDKAAPYSMCPAPLPCSLPLHAHWHAERGGSRGHPPSPPNLHGL